MVPAAAAEVTEVADWYFRTADADVAQQFIFEASAAQLALTTFPQRFRNDPAIGFRRIHVNSFPIVLWYEVKEEIHLVRILAATHNRMSDQRIHQSIAESGVPFSSVMPRLSTEELKELLRQRSANSY